MSYADLLQFAPNEESQSIFAKADRYLSTHPDGVCVSVSGGSDSDIVVDIISKVDNQRKVRYVFFDTGIEYEATKRHLDYLESKYNIQIERVKPKKSVPLSCKEYGVPWFSKLVSEMIERLQRHNFDWSDEPYEVLIQKYPRCKSALRWWCDNKGDGSRFNISRNKLMKEFIMSYPPQFKISSKCCYHAKKLPALRFCNQNDISLEIIGVRRSEHGIRSAVYSSCFLPRGESGGRYDKYLPLFWMTDRDKQEYEAHNNIVHSDCYSKYGLKRTGCFGCPFGSGFEDELAAIKEHEPKLYTAANNIFGQSYEYMRAYRSFKEHHKTEKD